MLGVASPPSFKAAASASLKKPSHSCYTAPRHKVVCVWHFDSMFTDSPAPSCLSMSSCGVNFKIQTLHDLPETCRGKFSPWQPPPTPVWRCRDRHGTPAIHPKFSTFLSMYGDPSGILPFLGSFFVTHTCNLQVNHELRRHGFTQTGQGSGAVSNRWIEDTSTYLGSK